MPVVIGLAGGDEQVGGDLVVEPGENGGFGAVDEARRLDHQRAGRGQGGDDQTGAARTAHQVVGGEPALQTEKVTEERLQKPADDLGQQRRQRPVRRSGSSTMPAKTPMRSGR